MYDTCVLRFYLLTLTFQSSIGPLPVTPLRAATSSPKPTRLSFPRTPLASTPVSVSSPSLDGIQHLLSAMTKERETLAESVKSLGSQLHSMNS